MKIRFLAMAIIAVAGVIILSGCGGTAAESGRGVGANGVSLEGSGPPSWAGNGAGREGSAEATDIPTIPGDPEACDESGPDGLGPKAGTDGTGLQDGSGGFGRGGAGRGAGQGGGRNGRV